MEDSIFLVEPHEDYNEMFASMIKEYEAAGEIFYYNIYKGALTDFDEYVLKLRNFAKGVDLMDGWVPMQSYWLTNKEKTILGNIRIRTSFDSEYVRKYIGNIGYDISPLSRGKGHGKLILKLGLEKAKEIGLEKVLITCNRENLRSARVIEANGGIYESDIYDENNNEFLRRYWIQLK